MGRLWQPPARVSSSDQRARQTADQAGRFVQEPPLWCEVGCEALQPPQPTTTLLTDSAMHRALSTAMLQVLAAARKTKFKLMRYFILRRDACYLEVRVAHSPFCHLLLTANASPTGASQAPAGPSAQICNRSHGGVGRVPDDLRHESPRRDDERQAQVSSLSISSPQGVDFNASLARATDAVAKRK